MKYAHRPILMMLFAIATLVLVVPGAAQAAGMATVKLSEWNLAIQGQEVGPGKIAFKVRNTGSYTHAFEIDHDGNRVVRSANIDPGQSSRVTASLDAGTYELYCPIDGHRANGMDARIRIGNDGLQVMQGDSGNTGNSGGSGYSY